MQIAKNPELMAGFGDSEVMRAVEEIGKDPSLIKTKYANDARVANFYRMMAGHVGQRLEQCSSGGSH
jgi:hypothetical protein